MKKFWTLPWQFRTGLIASLTLGLAPFTPEPHLFGKIRWVLGGGTGMESADYFDLVMHGAPWLLLVYGTILVLMGKRATPQN